MCNTCYVFSGVTTGTLLWGKITMAYNCDRDDVIKAFGLNPSHPIPKDLEGTTEYNGVTYILRVSPDPKRRKHRVFAVCPHCKLAIPFGRMCQHVQRRDHKPKPKMGTLAFNECCQRILNCDKANGFAKAYARAGLRMTDPEEIHVQAMYILSNIQHWHGNDAKLVRATLKQF